MLWSEPLYSWDTVQLVTDTDNLVVKVMSIIASLESRGESLIFNTKFMMGNKKD